ncbi:hypothetical protein AYI68_g4854 [Smittium mucronatum]|uniref:Uncharacterized protein n=1 Tax=Smittium mucronatum TaxID=133383 RepID=A0A1R0GVX6_9FUNG|nr:hypothetical protein AYI68_g4854 [Smittium mucronatum]
MLFNINTSFYFLVAISSFGSVKCIQTTTSGQSSMTKTLSSAPSSHTLSPLSNIQHLRTKLISSPLPTNFHGIKESTHFPSKASAHFSSKVSAHFPSKMSAHFSSKASANFPSKVSAHFSSKGGEFSRTVSHKINSYSRSYTRKYVSSPIFSNHSGKNQNFASKTRMSRSFSDRNPSITRYSRKETNRTQTYSKDEYYFIDEDIEDQDNSRDNRYKKTASYDDGSDDDDNDDDGGDDSGDDGGDDGGDDDDSDQIIEEYARNHVSVLLSEPQEEKENLDNNILNNDLDKNAQQDIFKDNSQLEMHGYKKNKINSSDKRFYNENVIMDSDSSNQDLNQNRELQEQDVVEMYQNGDNGSKSSSMGAGSSNIDSSFPSFPPPIIPNDGSLSLSTESSSSRPTDGSGGLGAESSSSTPTVGSWSLGTGSLSSTSTGGSGSLGTGSSSSTPTEGSEINRGLVSDSGNNVIIVTVWNTITVQVSETQYMTTQTVTDVQQTVFTTILSSAVAF